MGGESIVPPIVTSTLDGDEWSDSRTGRLNPVKQPPVPIGDVSGVPHSRSGRYEEDENVLSLPEIKPRPSSP
jgi:hypothetical protein